MLLIKPDPVRVVRLNLLVLVAVVLKGRQLQPAALTLQVPAVAPLRPHQFMLGRLPGWVAPRYYTQGMNTEMIFQTTSIGSEDTSRLGALLGSKLTGGEVIELVSDLGGGKTTFTQGLARGLGSRDNVVSPTFTLNKIYKGRGGLEIHHYDFYRLNDPGILKDELSESIGDPKTITVIEWSDIVKHVLPDGRISIEFKPTPNDADERQIIIKYAEKYANVVRELEIEWEDTRP